MIVLDASAAIEVILQLPASDALMARIFEGGESLHAPDLLDVEIAQVVRRYWRSGEITAQRGADALADLADLPVQRYAHTPLLERMWHLRGNATAYDACYLALTEALGAVLVTRDRALARVPGVRAGVEVF